jgi:hypothetical protein
VLVVSILGFESARVEQVLNPAVVTQKQPQKIMAVCKHPLSFLPPGTIEIQSSVFFVNCDCYHRNDRKHFKSFWGRELLQTDQ